MRKEVFCGRQVMVPGKAELFLDRLYPNWRRECVVYAHQDTFSIANVWKVDLTEYMLAVEKAEKASN